MEDENIWVEQATAKLKAKEGIETDAVKEYLACISELYPRYSHVCVLLLQRCESKILGE